MNSNLHVLKWLSTVTKSSVKGWALLLLILNSASLCANKDSREMSQIPVIAYIAAEGGSDAIFVHDSEGLATIFNCKTPNEMILTPQVSRNGEYITFVVDGGQNVRVVHLLGPLSKESGFWKAKDSTLLTVRGGAWPLFDLDKKLYLAMPDQKVSDSNMGIYAYEFGTKEPIRISDNPGSSNQIMPLISPGGDQIIYRELPMETPEESVVRVPRSMIFNLSTGSLVSHFENDPVFVEQWFSKEKILFSMKLNDQMGTRAYSVYNPISRSAVEIYRNVARQGRLSSDARYLAVIRPEPVNGSNYDIFIMDLQTQTETNLTRSNGQSESIIGWIEQQH